ncbi:hypothetical protein MSG28_009438 [Choristoneura fumiferana]|uniref:Uncharacterized protein n=1 Tax=Choristoneura fumiferana TaxID=7141 RepID=A0ACC0KY45_CHOFU|nr:hypothetical protein MSG28_009438 [Choristoneura fumiferana]
MCESRPRVVPAPVKAQGRAAQPEHARARAPGAMTAPGVPPHLTTTAYHLNQHTSQSLTIILEEIAFNAELGAFNGRRHRGAPSRRGGCGSTYLLVVELYCSAHNLEGNLIAELGPDALPPLPELRTL